MKINLLLITTFLSVIIFANINFETGHVGLTRLNGEGCQCHGIEFTDSVMVWIEGPDSLFVSDTVNYKILMTGGPAVAGGFNIAIRYGTIDSVDTLSHRMLFLKGFPLELTHTMPNPFINDTVFWCFKYTAPDSIVVDTIYSVANSANGDGIPFDDQWNFGANFPVKIVEKIIPVEFVSFNAVSDGNTISLTWSTATETNNYGFEVQRSINNLFYSIIGFVKGNGTTTENHDYSFRDKYTQQGVYNYRLKQIDFDGSFTYSDVIEVNVNVNTFSLEQNYPNPFNPTTTIVFSIPVKSQVSLKIFNSIGEQVAQLVNEEKPAGNYEVEFNSTGLIHQTLPSGIYFYRIQAGDPSTGSGQGFVETKKMILLK